MRSDNKDGQAREAVLSAFDALLDEDYDVLLESLEYRIYENGDYLARQGEAGYEAYLIMGGEVEVILRREDSSRLLGVPKAGEIVGEMAVLEKQPRVADMRARGQVSVLVFDRSRFVSLLTDNPALGLTLIKILSARMRANHHSMAAMSEKIRELEEANQSLAGIKASLEKRVEGAA